MENNSNETNDIAEVEKILTDFLFDETMNDILNFLERTKPLKFYRKFRFKKKIKKRYMIRVNPMSNLIADNFSFMLKNVKKHLNGIGEKI